MSNLEIYCELRNRVEGKYVMLYAICYHLYNLKNMKNTHGGEHSSMGVFLVF